MEIITSHNKTDLDGLASMVAASFLYPNAVCVLPTMVNPNVRRFLSLHKDLFRLHARTEIDPAGEEITRLIVVDTNHWSRLDRFDVLRERNGIEIVRWDHHLAGGNIEAHQEFQEETGAAVTLLARELKRRDCAFAPMQATLFLMGLYEDTGNLTFPSTRPEDARAAGFFLENGADLNVAAAYLSTAFDDDHKDLLARILEGSETLALGGFKMGFCMQTVTGNLNMLASVVSKFKELSGLDAAFGIFALEPGKTIVIGRGGAHGLDVGSVVRRLGGGGHPGAGSALVKDREPDAVYLQVMELVRGMEKPDIRIREIMSEPELCLSAATPMGEAGERVERTRARGALVMDGDRLLGIVTLAECRKAKSESQKIKSVKGFMKTGMLVLSPECSAREAMKFMAENSTGLIPVVEKDRVVGVVTRADLMLHIYGL